MSVRTALCPTAYPSCSWRMVKCMLEFSSKEMRFRTQVSLKPRDPLAARTV